MLKATLPPHVQFMFEPIVSNVNACGVSLRIWCQNLASWVPFTYPCHIFSVPLTWCIGLQGLLNKWPQTGWHKITEIFSLTHLEPTGQNQCVSGAMLSQETQQETPSSFSLVSGGCQPSSSLQHSRLCLHVHMASCLSVSSLLSTKKTFVIGFRFHLNNPGRSHLQIL
jgi:hypothetical protein